MAGRPACWARTSNQLSSGPGRAKKSTDRNELIPGYFRIKNIQTPNFAKKRILIKYTFRRPVSYDISSFHRITFTSETLDFENGNRKPAGIKSGKWDGPKN